MRIVAMSSGGGRAEWIGDIGDLLRDGRMRSIKKLGDVGGWVGDERRCDGADVLVVDRAGVGVAVDSDRYVVAPRRGLLAVREKDVHNWVFWRGTSGVEGWEDWMSEVVIWEAWRVMVWYLGAKSGCGPTRYGRL